MPWVVHHSEALIPERAEHFFAPSLPIRLAAQFSRMLAVVQHAVGIFSLDCVHQSVGNAR